MPTVFSRDGYRFVVYLGDHLPPWLAKASAEQQANYKLWPFSVDWPDLDEGLDIEWILNWQPQPE